MRVLLFQGWVDPERRSPDELLRAWPTLTGMGGALAAAGAQVTAVVAGSHDAEMEDGGVAWRFVRESSGLRLRRLLGHRAAPHPVRSLSLARSLPADVVHLHGLSFPFQARALASGRSRPPLLGQDHADRPPAGWRRPLHAWGLRGLAGAAFTHPDQAQPFREAGLFRDELPVFRVVEGSTGFTPGDRREARAATGMDGDPALLAVGDLAAGKDPSTLLDALETMAARLPGARLHLVFRGGDLEAPLRGRVEASDALRGRVRFVGEVAHAAMEAWHRAADLLVSASRREGSGYSVVEALACGTPAVVSDIAAHRGLLGDEPPGALVPTGDGTALAEAVMTAWGATRDPKAGGGGRTECRRAARARFEAALSWRAIADQLLGAYRTLTAGPGAAAAHSRGDAVAAEPSRP